MKAFNKIHAVWIITGVWILLFGAIRTVRHYIFKTNAYDLSLIDYGVANTLEGTLLYQQFYFDQSLLGIHFSPMLFLYVPFYLIYNDPLTLVWLQVVFTGLSAVPFYYLARWKLEDRRLALFLAGTYLLYRKLSTGVMYDFHVEMMEPLLVFSAFYFLTQKKYGWYFGFLVLALCVKEDMALYLIPLGIYVAFIMGERKVGLATVVLSVAWFVLAIRLMRLEELTHLDGLVYLGKGDFGYGRFGGSISEIFITFVTHPFMVLRELANPLSLKTFFNMLGCLLFIPLLCPATFALTFIPFFVNFISASDLQRGLGLYYSAPVIPFLFIAFLYGFKNLIDWLPQKRSHIISYLGPVILLINVANSALWQLMRPSRLAITEHHIIGHRLIEEIPAGVSVSGQGSLVPHIERRPQIYAFPNKVMEAEYVLLDTLGNKWPVGLEAYNQYIQQLKLSQHHRLIKEEDGYLLFQKITK